MTPEYLSSRFVFRNDITSYRLRNTENKLALPLPRTNYLNTGVSLTAEPGCGTAYLVTFVQQHLLHDFKLNNPLKQLLVCILG